MEDDSDPFTTGAGTRITLHLKEDCDEYTDEFKLREMLRRYSVSNAWCPTAPSRPSTTIHHPSDSCVS